MAHDDSRKDVARRDPQGLVANGQEHEARFDQGQGRPARLQPELLDRLAGHDSGDRHAVRDGQLHLAVHGALPDAADDSSQGVPGAGLHAEAPYHLIQRGVGEVALEALDHRGELLFDPPERRNERQPCRGDDCCAASAAAGLGPHHRLVEEVVERLHRVPRALVTQTGLAGRGRDRPVAGNGVKKPDPLGPHARVGALAQLQQGLDGAVRSHAEPMPQPAAAGQPARSKRPMPLPRRSRP